jgi:hypothetical protein
VQRRQATQSSDHLAPARDLGAASEYIAMVTSTKVLGSWAFGARKEGPSLQLLRLCRVRRPVGHEAEQRTLNGLSPVFGCRRTTYAGSVGEMSG